LAESLGGFRYGPPETEAAMKLRKPATILRPQDLLAGISSRLDLSASLFAISWCRSLRRWNRARFIGAFLRHLQAVLSPPPEGMAWH
jgi:hypothetical protein